MVYTYIETNPQRKEDCTLKTLLIDLPTVLPVAVTKPRIQPPLWAAYLASYLATDTILDYLDARSENDACWGIREEWKVWGIPLEQLVQEITTRQPDVVGIHVGVSTEIGLADQLVHEMRLLERFTPRILLGGPGVALVPDEFLPNHLRGAEICRTVGSENHCIVISLFHFLLLTWCQNEKFGGTGTRKPIKEMATFIPDHQCYHPHCRSRPASAAELHVNSAQHVARCEGAPCNQLRQNCKHFAIWE